LQTAALPLGYRARRAFNLFAGRGFLKPTTARVRFAARLLYTLICMATPLEGQRPVRSTSHTRGRLHLLWDVLFGALRLIARHATNAYTVFGVFLVSGILIAVACTWAFSSIALRVRAGRTQAFDDAIMRWIGGHQYPPLQSAMLEVTSLGTGVVVGMIVLVSGMFLWLNKHKHSAILLFVATGGGILLDNLLKVGFNRPRPQIFKWGTYAMSSSFPSGHAMSSVIVYGTVAYLAARLQRNVASRVLTLVFAAFMIASICVSRLYLGVHFPSDVLAGVIVGLAWAGLCMAMLEASQIYAKRNAPQLLKDEVPAPPGASPSS
jgi:undecaprenyl-diphosphatase